MNRRLDSHIFWGRYSPLSVLTGAGLIVMASGRFAHALVCAGALVWVYGLTTLVFCASKPIMPSRGKRVILLFLSSFLCGIFMLLTSLLNPLLILATAFFLILIPPFCLGTGFFEALGSEDIIEVVFRALLEAVTLAGLILAFALVREPLGIGTISIPGGIQGIRELYNGQEADNYIPVRIFSVSSGGLLLLGYGTALYRYFRELNGQNPRHSNRAEDEE